MFALPTVLAPVTRSAGWFGDRLPIWRERRARRLAEAALRELSDGALKDLGIDRSEIASVASATRGTERRRYLEA